MLKISVLYINWPNKRKENIIKIPTHNQGVHGSSPCGPTLIIKHLRSKICKCSFVGGNKSVNIFLFNMSEINLIITRQEDLKSLIIQCMEKHSKQKQVIETTTQENTKAQFKLLLENKGFKVTETSDQLNIIKNGVVQANLNAEKIGSCPTMLFLFKSLKFS
jgi:hypothetical protein